MDDTNGFYRIDINGEFQYAPNFVYGPDYTLVIEDKDTYSYPVAGWSWYPDETTAKIALGK